MTKKNYGFQNTIRRINKTKNKMYGLFFEKYFVKYQIKFWEKTKVKKME